MDDGFVKEPAVVTQRNFNASQYNREELERIKLMDGIRLHEHPEYVPDFVIEISDSVLMVETKAQNEMTDKKVLVKAEAAARWCQHASDYLLKHGGKEWKYLLVPHDEVKEQNDLSSYVQKYQRKLVP